MHGRQPRMAQRAALAAAPVLLLAALLLAPVALAHFDSSGQYTHSGCPGVVGNRVDPNNVLILHVGHVGSCSSADADARWVDEHERVRSILY